MHDNLPVDVDLDDLIHAGVSGMFDAATKYSPAMQVVFHSLELRTVGLMSASN